MGNKHSCRKAKLAQPQPQPKLKVDKDAILHKISSRRPIFYSNLSRRTKNYRELLTKRKYHRKVDIYYPNLVSQLKSQRNLIKLLQRAKNPRSVILRRLLKNNSDGPSPRFSTTCSFIRGINRVKLLSIDFSSPHRATTRSLSHTSQSKAK